MDDRPYSSQEENGQPSKTINAPAQQRLRSELRRKKLAEKHRDAVVACSTINDILSCNNAVEALFDVTVAHFLLLNTSKLQDFIHARMFDSKTSQKTKIAGADRKLNKTRYKSQTAESVETDCLEEEPCIVGWTWKLPCKILVLKAKDLPVLNTSLPTPNFSIVYSRPVTARKPSDYLKDNNWVDALELVLKGVNAVPIKEELMDNANNLALALDPRLNFHIGDRVDETKHDHWTLQFTRDNISPMAAAMCLVGHVVGDIKKHRLDERLLVLPMEEMFQIITGDLISLEGCYLYFDKCKYNWIWSGKSSGDGGGACFRSRGKKHLDNAKSKGQMRVHRLYREYPALGMDNLGTEEDNFENLVMHCGMAYDKKDDVAPLCSQDACDGLFVWSNEAITELKKRRRAKKDPA
jgi:hypothetical protein